MSRFREFLRFYLTFYTYELPIALILLLDLIHEPDIQNALWPSYYLLVPVAAFFLVRRSPGSVLRIIIIDAAHVMLLGPVIFVLLAGLGGVSMAVADGVADDVRLRYFRYTRQMLVFMALSQLFVLPWVWLSHYWYRRSETANMAIVLLAGIGIAVLLPMLLLPFLSMV